MYQYLLSRLLHSTSSFSDMSVRFCCPCALRVPRAVSTFSTAFSTFTVVTGACLVFLPHFELLKGPSTPCFLSAPDTVQPFSKYSCEWISELAVQKLACLRLGPEVILGPSFFSPSCSWVLCQTCTSASLGLRASASRLLWQTNHPSGTRTS